MERLSRCAWANICHLVLALSILLSCGKRTHPRDDLVAIAEVKKAIDHGPGGVRFQGVVTVVNPNFGYFFVQDATDSVKVQATRFADSSLVGHLLEIRGHVSSTGDRGISEAEFKDLGPAALPAATRLDLEDIHSDEQDGKLVTISGIARRGRFDSSGQLVVKLSRRGAEASLRFIDDLHGSLDNSIGAELEATGVALINYDIDGKLSDITLLAPNLKSIKVLSKPVDRRQLPLVDTKFVSQMNTRDTDAPFRLHGRLVRKSDASVFEFRDSAGSLPVANAVGIDSDQTADIDVVAFADGDSLARHLCDVTVVGLEKAMVKRPVGATLTTVAEVRRLSVEEAGFERALVVEGVVTYVDPTWQMMFFQDDTAGIYVALHGAIMPAWIKAGNRVRLSGVTGPGDFAPIIQKASFEYLGQGKLPQPAKTSVEDTFSGLADSQWVRLEGIVSSIGVEANHPFVKLSWGTHEYRVLFPPDVVVPTDWINRRFRVEGACGTLFNGKRQVLGIQLFAADPRLFKRLPDSTNRDALSAVSQLLRFSPSEAPGHSVHLRGKVTASQRSGPTWIRDGSGAVVIRNHNDIALSPGDVVDVFGFPIAGTFSAEIHDAKLQRISSGTPNKPIDASPYQALFGGLNGELVRIRGRLLGQFVSGHDQTLLLESGRNTFVVQGPMNLPTYEIGSQLAVTGICNILAKRFRGILVPNEFSLFIDSATAISVVRRAPWLTGGRTLRVLGVTVVMSAAVLLWGVLLRRKVGQQTEVIAQKLREVESLKETAEAASAAKSQFLANMSHEIRTPLNGILGMTEVALGSESAGEQRECLSIIRSSGDALLAILNDLLDLSKIEAGKFELENAPFSLRDQVADAGKVFIHRLREKGLNFESSVNEDLPDIYLGDALRIRQVLLNVLGNAVKFTDEGEVSLTVSGERKDEIVELCFRVRDTGLGIAPDQQARIFEAFRQAETSTARRFGGTGLGLSICARLVTLMGGEIAVESEIGKGSTFVVTIPLQTTTDTHGIAALDRVVAASGVPLNILLAEDNVVNQTLAVKLLRRQGHLVTVAANGRLAVQAVEKNQFDVILMDVQMPEMDGLDATAEIRRRERISGRHTPIIAMTAQTMKGDRDRCFAVGMDGFISKPIRLPALYAVLGDISETKDKTPAPLV